MLEPFSIIGLLATVKAAITTWVAKEGADFVKDKVTGFAKDKSKEFGKKQLTQFRENAKLHLRQLDQSIPKALRLAYLQATLQVCALRSDELGANVTSYSQYFKGKILRWQKRYDETFGVMAQAELQWLDHLHKWLRAEIAKAKEGKLPPLEITEQDFADLIQFEEDGNAETLRQRLTGHLVAELEHACPGMPDRFRSLLIEGWYQFDVHEQAQRQTWFDCFCVCFQQALAKDLQAREFFQNKLLAGIMRLQQQIDFEQFAVALQQLNLQLAAQDVEVYFDDLSSQLDTGFVALHDHLDKVAEKVDRVAVKVEESTAQVIKAQDEQTRALLNAVRPVERAPEDEFSYYTSQALRTIRNKLSGFTDSLPRFEITLIEEQWQLGKPVLLSGEPGTGKSGIAAVLARQAGKPVLLLDARNVAQLSDEPSLRRYFNSTAPLSQTIVNLANNNGFRLIIDQLDNLIGKESANLIINLALECGEANAIEVIIISRNKEAHEARLLRRLTAAGFVEIESRKLREVDVAAVLAKLGINSPTQELVRLGQNLLNLEIICLIRREQPDFDFSIIGSETALWEQYLEVLRERESLADGIDSADLLIATATEFARMSLRNGSPTFVLEPPIKPIERRLDSWGIIVCQEGRIYSFGHEKFQDYLYARYMCEQGSLPSAVKAEVGYHRMRNILPLMEAIYTAGNSTFLIPFLREAFNV
jgi:ATPase family associated with various cellular activities (AAA)